MTTQLEEIAGIGARSNREIRAEYEAQVQTLHLKLLQIQKRARRAKTATIVLLVAMVVALIGMWHTRDLYLAALPAMGAAVAMPDFIGTRRRCGALARRVDFYERGLERLSEGWQQTEATGLEFAREGHRYQFDLNVVGERSLFTLLGTTRSEAGAARLAEYLLDATTGEEARQRQEAVRELRGSVELREEIALLGRYEFLRGETRALREWAEQPLLPPRPAAAACLIVLSAALAASALAVLAGWVAWQPVLPVALLLAVGESWLAWPSWREVRTRAKRLGRLGNELAVLRGGIGLLQRQEFAAPKLRRLVEAVQGQDAWRQLARLQRLITVAEQRDKEWFYAASFALAVGTQLVLAAERWRARYAQGLRVWIEAWAEFEALEALAGYAYEHPEHVFPEIVTDTVTFCARWMGHPLLAEEICVRNDVELGEAARFYMVSGSNMSGKSTLLRAIGLNAVLAAAGAPVCAREARLSVFRVCASITTSDSLLEGRSRFLAEAERLRATLRCAEEEEAVLFLIDEVFSGTNSQDRRIAAEGLIEALTRRGAVGAISTHDLALTEIAERAELRGRNVHMESEDAEDPLRFDYRLKPGIAQRSNAVAILRRIGIL